MINVVKVAIDIKAVQITAFSTSKRLNKVYRSCGLISKKSRFCYYDDSFNHSSELKGNIYFTLGDSDNDDYIINMTNYLIFSHLIFAILITFNPILVKIHVYLVTLLVSI